MRDSVVSLRSVYVPSPPVDSVGRPRWRDTGGGLGRPGEDDWKPSPATDSGPTSAGKVGDGVGAVSRRPNTSRSIAEIHSRLAAREERARRGAPGPEDMVEIVCGGSVSRGTLAEREREREREKEREREREREKERERECVCV